MTKGDPEAVLAVDGHAIGAAGVGACVPDDAFVGDGAVVLPGARIGKHVTIGANSVVTGEIPDYSVAVGSPAKVIRRYLDGQGWVTVP